MEEKKNRLGALLKSLGSGERRVKLIVIVGFLGIFLLFLSQFTGKKEETKTEPVGDAAAYTEALQKELTALIGQIEGAGKTTVLVTLQNDWETLYVSGEKTDSAKESSGGDSFRAAGEGGKLCFGRRDKRTERAGTDPDGTGGQGGGGSL